MAVAKTIVTVVFVLICLIGACVLSQAQNVTINAVDEPAPAVFRSIVEQTGLNFVYASDLLKDMRVTVKAVDRPLKEILSDMFRDSDIHYKREEYHPQTEEKGKTGPAA